MTRTLVRTTILLLSVAACASAPPPPPVLVALPQTAGDVAASPDPAIVSVTTVRAPQAVAVDGDLAEWGSLPPPQPSLPAPPRSANDSEPANEGAPAKKEGAPAKKEEPPPNPREAPSHLAFAVTHEAVLIAAELGEPARDGIWLGIGARAPDLPVLGQSAGRAGFLPLQCENEVVCYEADNGGDVCMVGDKPNPPEAVAACKALVARYAKVKIAHEARFTRFFKIDREGVRKVSADGELVAIAGAKSAWKPGPKGATAEISLPLAAMPRVAEVPLESLRLVARAATSPKPPELGAGQWVWVKLPEAVSFEPYGALRAHAFTQQREYEADPPSFGEAGRWRQPQCLSYQPGDALHVESGEDYGSATTEVTPRKHALYEKLAGLGDVEIGYALDSSLLEHRELGIFKNGRLVDIVELSGGNPRGVVTRDGELHVFSASSQPPAIWSVVAVASDGKHRKALESVTVKAAPAASGQQAPSWHDVSDFASKELDSFGWRGALGGRGVEVTWRWDGARKMYTGKEHRIPVLRRAREK